MLSKEIFLEKAAICGIKGAALKWLESYLTGRSQVVAIGEEVSSIIHLDNGTPQGSSCSCLVFALFVGDASLWTCECLMIAFADDTFITVVADTREELIKKLEIYSERVLSFFSSNRMDANPGKTGLLVLRPMGSNVQKSKVEIRLGDATVHESDVEKLLGVQIQSNLKWNEQTKKVKAELQYALSVLQRLQPTLGKKDLKTIANGIFMSRLRYALPVYGSAILRLKETDSLPADAKELQVLQNDMLRLLTGNKRRDKVRITEMLRETNILSVNQLIAYGMLMEVWKAKEFDLPFLGSLLVRTSRSDERTLRSDSGSILSPALPEYFSETSSRLWNMCSERFKTTNLLKIAQSEARKFVMTLPV